MWDVPENVFNLEDQTMANIYCQHTSAAVIIIDATDPDALKGAEGRIATLKEDNARISIMMFVNGWDSPQRMLNVDEMDSFCKRVHSFISWQRVQTVSADEELEQESLIALDVSIKRMISAEIRHGARTLY